MPKKILKANKIKGVTKHFDTNLVSLIRINYYVNINKRRILVG